MKIPDKKLKSGFSLPELGLGTWKFGGGFESDYSNDENDIKSIQSAIELGYRHIDTAEIYGNKHCEELVGEAIKKFDRSELIIATKVGGDNLGHDDTLKSAEGSLKRFSGKRESTNGRDEQEVRQDLWTNCNKLAGVSEKYSHYSKSWQLKTSKRKSGCSWLVYG